MKQNRIYLPIMLDVTGKKFLLIGAGKACAEKLRSLSQLAITADVISPDFSPEFLNKPWLHLIQREYRDGDLTNYDIVYVGVNNPEVEDRIRKEANRSRVIINFVDNVTLSDFISPSVLQKDHYSIFISTYGKGPGMTKKIRQTLEEKIDLNALDKEAEEYIIKRKTNEPG